MYDFVSMKVFVVIDEDICIDSSTPFFYLLFIIKVKRKVML